MRFQDFKLVEAPGDEIPAKKMANVNVASDTFDDKEVNDLQQQVADRVMRVQDPSVLHRVEAILRKGGITRISNAYFKRDSDAEKFVNRLATMIIELEIPTNDKIAFLKEFATTNCIKPEAIFDNTSNNNKVKIKKPINFMTVHRSCYSSTSPTVFEHQPNETTK